MSEEQAEYGAQKKDARRYAQYDEVLAVGEVYAITPHLKVFRTRDDVLEFYRRQRDIEGTEYMDYVGCPGEYTNDDAMLLAWFDTLAELQDARQEADEARRSPEGQAKDIEAIQGYCQTRCVDRVNIKVRDCERKDCALWPYRDAEEVALRERNG